MTPDEAMSALADAQSRFHALPVIGVRPRREAADEFLSEKKKLTDVLVRAEAAGTLSRDDKDALRTGLHRLRLMIDRMAEIGAQEGDRTAPGVTISAGGFSNLGEFADALVRASTPHIAEIDPRLRASAGPTTFGSERSGADGGFLVPPEWSDSIFGFALEQENLLSFCRSTPIAGNSMVFPASEVTPWGSSGVQVAWQGEASQLAQSKPEFETRTLRLAKLTALVPVTNELLEDSRALAAWLPRELGNAARWAINNAIVNGTGAGQPAGFSTSGALVTQSKEAGQGADTVVAGNVSKMFSRCLNPGRAVWLINPDAFPQLPLMTIGDQPVWVPNSDGLRSSPGGMLMGRPVIMTDACSTLGDPGDLYFADLSSYVVIQKSSGMRIDTSAHLWFDFDQTAFRLTFRIDGQSIVEAPVTPPNSPTTRSPFVRLAERA